MLATKLEHQGSGSPVQNRPMAPPPPISPTISELHGYEVPRPLPGPPPGPPPNWNHSKPPLPQRKAVAESISTMSSQDPESPLSQGILTPSISEMSISDRAPEPSIVSAIDYNERDIQTPVVEEKIAAEDQATSRDLQAGQPSTQGPPRIHIDRSTLRFRVPKQNSGASNTSLKSALISAVTAEKSKIVEQLLDRGVPPDTGPEKNALCIATSQNDLESLKLLLGFGGDPNLKGVDGLPPLRWACQYNFPTAARLLLEFGADPNISTPDWSVLPWALDDNKEEIVRDLLLYGADPNLVMTNGVISLRYACDRDVKPSLVQDLLNYGADPNLKDAAGETSLSLACYRNKPEIVEILLAHGADPNLAGNDLPIECALRYPDCMKLLISAGADFKLFKGLMELAVYYNAIDTVRLMLDANMDPNEKKDDYYTPLTTAIRDNHPEIVSLLLSRGANPHQKGEGFPLAGAVRRPEILKMLLAAGADVKSYQGLIELAVWGNNLESVKILLEAGVPIDEKHQNCYTPLTTAVRDNRPEMLAFLLAHGADPNLKGEDVPLAMAASKPAILKQLLEGGADITKSKGVLEYAIYYNSLESVKILLEAGEDINYKHDGVYTPLTTAIRDNRTEILSYLLSRGADPNVLGEGLPLINASRYADPHRLKMLLDAGADVNRKDDNGSTALMAACEKGLIENVKILMERGGDVDLADRGGKTAMDYAVTEGHDDLVMVLLDTME